jgi:hypothetical protein
MFVSANFSFDDLRKITCVYYKTSVLLAHVNLEFYYILLNCMLMNGVCCFFRYMCLLGLACIESQG